MSKKIIGMFICMLILIPVLSSTVTAEEPVLEINIRARSTILFGATLIREIRNIGDADAVNVSVTTRLKHPIFKILDFTSNKTIDIIEAGKTIILTIGLSWIGRFEFTVTASIQDGASVTKTVRGFCFRRIILLFPD
ncbi:MAG: hypothetical protein ACXACW_16135 [Candidatus Hodarchaeales archaeon]|jgi:hypothetical protein